MKPKATPEMCKKILWLKKHCGLSLEVLSDRFGLCQGTIIDILKSQGAYKEV